MTDNTQKTISKAQQAAVNRYVKNNYDRINVTLPKGEKALIQKAADNLGMSVNNYIRTAIREKMAADGIPMDE